MDAFNSLIIWLTGVLSPVLKTPSSTVFIFFLVLGLTLIVVTVNRLAVDIKKLQGFELEIRKHASSLNKAKRMNDKAALRRLKREELRLKQLRSYVSKQRLKASFITLIPLIMIYLITSTVYLNVPVAVLPVDFPLIGREVPFPIWYMLCYFAFYFPLSKLFGVSPT